VFFSTLLPVFLAALVGTVAGRGLWALGAVLLADSQPHSGSEDHDI
jgi:hypothetical protein